MLFKNSAFQVNETINPAKLSPETIYIGLEHIEQKTLQLKNYGNASQVTSNKKFFQKGDILFGKLNPHFRKVIFAEFDGICSTDIWVIRPKKNVDKRFLYYWCADWSFVDFVNSASEGTSLPRAKWEVAINHEIFNHDYKNQKVIGHILSCLDEKIKINKKINETLEGIAKALFKSWFIDFDPVRIKSEGSSSGLPQEINKLFPDSFEVSDFGTIPKGWSKTKLSDIAYLNPESWTSKDHPEKIEYLDLSGVKSGNIQESNIYTWSKAPSRAKRILRTGDTIIGIVRPGNKSYCMIQKEGFTGSTGFATLRPKNQINAPLVYLVSTSQENIERLSHLADGAAYPAVKPEVIIETSVILPTNSIQKIFGTLISPIFCKISENKMESDHLSNIRNTLLPRLMSGQIEIPDAKKMLEEAGI